MTNDNEHPPEECFSHLEERHLEHRLESIIHDTRHRPPTMGELGVFGLYVREYQERAKKNPAFTPIVVGYERAYRRIKLKAESQGFTDPLHNAYGGRRT